MANREVQFGAYGAYFSVDTSSYLNSVNQYDPLVANQTLVFERFANAIIVDDEVNPNIDDSSEDFLKQLTPKNEELKKLAKAKPASQDWITGDEEKPF